MKQVGHHLVVEAAPGYIAPVGWDVLVERLVLPIELVEKRSPTLPGEGGHLPGVAVREQLSERVTPLLILRGQEQLQVAFAFDELVLLSRTPFKDAHQVLDALLTCFDNFLDPNSVGHMANDR